jgi:hypothetical protein
MSERQASKEERERAALADVAARLRAEGCTDVEVQDGPVTAWRDGADPDHRRAVVARPASRWEAVPYRVGEALRRFMR